MIRKTVTQTRAGAVQGYFTGQCLLFAGTPYAAPSSGGFAPRVPHDLSAFTARTCSRNPKTRGALMYGPRRSMTTVVQSSSLFWRRLCVEIGITADVSRCLVCHAA
jgi:hypothetical protein